MVRSVICFIVLGFTLKSYVFGQTTLIKCRGAADIVFAVDGSDSMTDEQFSSIMNVIENLVDEMNMMHRTSGPVNSNIRAAALVYSTGNNFQLYHNYFNLVAEREEFRDAMTLLRKGRVAMGSETNFGIERLRGILTAMPRFGVPLVGIVFTDGRSSNAKETLLQAQTARNVDRIHMISVGVGCNIKEDELLAIASGPDDVIINHNFDDFNTLTLSQVNKRLCGKVVAVTRKTTSSATTSTTTIITKRSKTTKPSTTTYTTTTKPPPPPPLRSSRKKFAVSQLTDNELCSGCQIDQGFGYNFYPEDCQLFVQCYMPSNAAIVATVRNCGYGKMWSYESLTCVAYNDPALNCMTDRCESMLDNSDYAMSCSCRGYWTCLGGKTVSPNCCSRGHRFEEGQGCLVDPSCEDGCGTVEGQYILKDPECAKDAVEGDIYSYREKFNGGGMVRSCAPGTVFNSDECQCLHDSDFNLFSSECRPLVNFPFRLASQFRDTSGNHAFGHAENLNIDTEGAYFDGTGYFLIHYLSYRDFQSTLVIRFEMRPEVTTSPNAVTETVITNCFWCDYDVASGYDPSSIHIKVKKEVHVPISQSRIKTTNGLQTKAVDTSSISSYDWHEEFVVFSGSVRHESRLITYSSIPSKIETNTDAYERIVRAQSGFVLGRSPSKNGYNFKGHIRNFRVYDCIPDDLPTKLMNVVNQD